MATVLVFLLRLEIEFDERYDGNPLVNAMCVGIIDHDMVQKGTAKGVGNSVIYVGLKTGRDGIHGATFASEELTEESESKDLQYKLEIHL